MKRRHLLLILLAAFIAPWRAFGNVLTVYDGTATNDRVPAYINYFDDFTRSQFVIPASDLTEMNGKSIYKMWFFTTNLNVPYTTTSSAKVYLKEVSYTQINDFEPIASTTVVYTGYFDIQPTDNGGVLYITFDVPFDYHGGNLLIGIENTEDNDWMYINFCGQTVNGASVAGSNGTNPDYIQPAPQNFIPTTTFEFYAEHTVYEGTVTNNRIPTWMYNYDNFTRSQFIIPAEELVEMLYKNVYSMTFYTTASNVPYTAVSSAKVYLKEVNHTTINAYETMEDSDRYFQGYLDIVSTGGGGEMRIDFQYNYYSSHNYFWYQGGDLLVCIENTENNGWQNIFFYGQTVTDASISGYSYSGLNNITTYAQQNFIPKTTFGYEDDCSTYPLPLVYGFEDDDYLNCWTRLYCHDNTYGDPTASHTGSYGFQFHYNTNPPQYLISPKFEGTTAMDFSFYYRNASNNFPETFQVGYSTTTKSPNAFIWGPVVTASQNTWHLYEDQYPIGTRYVAIKYLSNDQLYLYVDDFSFLPHFCDEEDQCELTFELTDSYGDGWNDAAINVVDAETHILLASLSAPSHGGGNVPSTDIYTLNVCDGRELRFEWVEGEYDEECSYTVTDINGNVIVTGQYSGFDTFTHTVDCTRIYIFLTDGNWNDGSHWNTGFVPPAGADVIIQADAIVPAGYLANAGAVTLDGGSITVADGGQLRHNTIGLEVTMEKHISGYTDANGLRNYYLLAFPFIQSIPVPAAMTANEGCDFYKFSTNYPNAEWRNYRLEDINSLIYNMACLYASPVDLDLSLTGLTSRTTTGWLFTVSYYYNPNKIFNGWMLLGNPFTCNAYAYSVVDGAEVPLQVMMYNADGELVTCSNGPIAPMQAFFVKITETTTIHITTTAPEHAYVDLGLPSGTLWATCNVGASSPEDYGDYFAWGETQPKDDYSWSTYQHCNGSENTLTKYCNDASYGYNGFTDNLTTLQPEDDAATANWGNGWRMPTNEEWQELYNNTTMTWTQQNGVYGRLFTASNGNSLFLPAAGYRCYAELDDAGDYGYYWSSSLYTDRPYDAWYFRFFSGYYGMYYGFGRYFGLTVRPVRN